MDEVKRNQYFYLLICQIGLLFIALVTIRALSIYQDALGFALGFIGFSFVTAHLKFVEKNWGISKKQSFFNTIGFILVFIPLAYGLSYPH